MHTPRLFLVLFLTSCSARSLTGSDVCDLIRQEVEARTLACTGDAALAESAAKSLDTKECLLPADDTAIGVHGPSLADCVEAITKADCAAVATSAQNVDFWLGLDFHCPAYIGTPSDTGAAQ